MALILKVISYKGAPPRQEISARFDKQGGSVGRAPDNSLVLPDPEKYISRLHATICFEGGVYSIRDSSSGGTFLRSKNVLLQDNQASLESGEILQLGEYELLVAIEDNQPVGTASILPEPVRQLELAENSFLDDPFAVAVKTSAPDDFLSSFIDQPESSVIHQSFNLPSVSNAPATSGIDDLDFGDLIAKLDNLPKPKAVNSTDLPLLPDDFFAEESSSDNEPALSGTTPFTKPDLAFNLVEGPGSVDPGLTPDEELTPSVSVDMHQSTVADTDGIVLSNNQSKEWGAVDKAPQETAGAFNGGIHSGQYQAAATDSELLREFLTGAGVPGIHLPPSDKWPEMIRMSGQLLRGMVEGLMQVLRARAELKSQFRVSVTTMRSIDNNPLKFTPNVDDAISLMLQPTNPGFLSPRESVREGFSDIMNHQLAMTAGIQAALSEILRNFDPELIEKSQGEGLMFQKKAKCWDCYIDKYPQLKAAAQEGFFGDVFAEAYEKQMLLLSRSSKKQ